jgi:glycosyltransferase involved in cell wall biosynthesis
MRILLASPFLVYPDTNGAKARILAFIRMLAREGCEVHFAYMGIDKADPAQCADLMCDHCASFTDLRDEAYPWAEPGEDGYQIDDWVSEAQVQGFRDLHDRLRPDITIVNYIFFSRLLEGLSSLKVIDLHDRLARAEQYEAINEPPKFFYTTEARELEAVQRADIALCIQDNEKPYFERANVPVFTFGHILRRSYLDRRFTNLTTVGYIGAFNIFNNHALGELLPLFASLVEDFPDLRLRLAGGICNAIEDVPPFVEKVGYVPSLGDFYDDVDLTINPTIAGTGLKIKTVEALSFGMPLVSTRVGMDGLPVKSDFHAATSIEELARMIRTIKQRDFKELTKLANLSKVIHTEYTESQKNTIHSFLTYCKDCLEASRRGSQPPVAETNAVPVHIADLQPPRMSESMLHVLNPFNASESSDNFLAQPITYQSIADAKDFARHHVKVDVLNLHMPEESPVSHPVFTYTRPLSESSKDYLVDYPRSLPLLRDILGRAAEFSEYDWLIYTNVDISLTPAFYRRLIEYIEDGHDAIVINRRTITKQISGSDQISTAYGEIGKKHPGFDCFVFRRDLVEKFDLFDTLVGVHLIGRMLIWNLLKHARSVHVEKQAHLTFHIGDDVPSKDIGETAVIAHNFRQAALFWEKAQSETGMIERIQSKADAAQVQDAKNFGVGRLVTPRVHRPAEVPSSSCPVHLHGHFRCGSTFLFRSLRRDPGNMCFYEPFHEDIETFSIENLNQKKTLHAPQNFHKEHDGDWFFAEIEPLIVAENRVPGFRAAFGTEFFGDNRPNTEIETYIRRLIQHAYDAGRRPILQFNRSGLRMEYFRRTFPDHAHFFLLRDLGDQWNSYLRFLQNGRRGFLRSMIACLGQGRKGDRLTALNDLVPLYRLEGTHNLHTRYDPIFDLYTIEQLYICFYYMWMVSLLDAVTLNVPILRMSRMSSDPVLQARTDVELISMGLAVDWSTLSTDSYTTTYLSEENRKDCEAAVNAHLLKIYGTDILDQMEQADFEKEADSLKCNATPSAHLTAHLRAMTSMDGMELYTQALDHARKLRAAEAKNSQFSHLLNEPHKLPTVLPGHTCFSVKAGDFAQFASFTGNFAIPEETHVWTIGKQSALAFRLPYHAEFLRLRIFMSASTELIDKNAMFSVELNGERVAFETCQSWRWLEVEVSSTATAAGRNGTCMITLNCEKEVENLIERRKLYFSISEIKVDYNPIT